MTQRQLNMIQSAQDGVELARSELSGPGSRRKILEVLRDYFGPETSPRMTVGLAAYLACYMIAWRGIGSPDPFQDEPDF